MSYHTRYGLAYNPFIKNESKDVLIQTQEYKECSARLDQLLKTRGFGLVTGAAGLGKTTTIRKWSQGLNPSLYDVIYISLSTITVDQFYSQLAQALRLEVTNKKTTNFKNIQESIKTMATQQRKTPVIILDEANYLMSKILNDLKILFNFDMDSKDHAIILLVGLPLLNNTLNTKSNEALRQRIVMSYQLDVLNKEQAKEYILEKLKEANGIHEIFNENALHAITSHCNGTLREINKLCNACLLIAEKLKLSAINEEVVLAAINEITI